MSIEIPSKLFRYTWLNPKYEESFKRIFEKNDIYSPLVSELNDPFDCIQELNIEEIPEADMRKKIIEGSVKEGYPVEKITQLNGYLQLLGCRKYLLYKYYTKVIPYFKKSRILSLSSIADDFAMWVFYSNVFQGFCLEIEPDEDWESILFPIDYIENPLKFSFIKLTEPDFKTKPYVSTKTKYWEHEKEWRVYNHHRNLTDRIPLPKGGIKCIYFGMHMSEEDKLKIKGWCEEFSPSTKIKDQSIDLLGMVKFS
jgi:hypothetical protein